MELGVNVGACSEYGSRSHRRVSNNNEAVNDRNRNSWWRAIRIGVPGMFMHERGDGERCINKPLAGYTVVALVSRFTSMFQIAKLVCLLIQYGNDSPGLDEVLDEVILQLSKSAISLVSFELSQIVLRPIVRARIEQLQQQIAAEPELDSQVMAVQLVGLKQLLNLAGER